VLAGIHSFPHSDVTNRSTLFGIFSQIVSAAVIISTS
jgi:hypothetical protein